MLHVSAANCSVTWKVANIYQQFYLDCSHGEHVNHVCLFTMVYLQSDSAITNMGWKNDERTKLQIKMYSEMLFSDF